MPTYSAKTADKHVLYQEAVQCAEAEVAIVDRVYRRHYGRVPTLLREDFCGTALVCCEWARHRKENHSYGVDLCAETLAWGRAHNVAKLSADAAARVHLINDNVLRVQRPAVEVAVALNYSYFIFKTLPELVAYFRVVRSSLQREGLFIVDAYGGWDSQRVLDEKKRHRGFTYIWEQAAYNPINDHTVCHISFKFPDGTQMKRAFTYDWRLWTLGGIQDALIEAGFSSCEVYWEGSGRNGEGDGVFRRKIRADNSPGWNAYIVGIT